jgi:hypothetical protein
MPVPYVPAPGSPQAQQLGCDCPDVQNHHGVVPPLGDQWWVGQQCPVHAPWLTARKPRAKGGRKDG